MGNPGKFYSQKNCDRCGKPLTNGRTMSMFNTDCICLDCKNKERDDPRYSEAIEAERASIECGNYNFEGIGYKS